MIWLLFFLVICPLAIGDWFFVKCRLKSSFSRMMILPLGFFCELAIFEILEFPFALLHWGTKSLTWTYTVILICLLLFSIISRKAKYGKPNFPKLSVEEWIYLILAICISAFILYKSVVTDFTEDTYDDATYLVIANDAINTDTLFMTATTGVGTRLDAHRAMQSSLVFPSVLSILSGYSVVLIEHCFLQVFFLVLAYLTFASLACVLFPERVNRLIFYILVLFLYIFGLYGNIAVFRLLMPNYQGKSVLASSVTPLYFTLLVVLLQKEYDWRAAFLLMIMSIASVSLTLLGAVATLVNVGIPVIISMFFKKCHRKNLLYIPIAGVFPAIYGTVLIVYRFFV